jgi:hypothetical protein
MNFAELPKWCIEHEHIPYDEDEPFVVNYQICTDEDSAEKDENKDIKIKIGQFRILVSTKRLLKLIKKTHVLQTDATYKLTWHGFSVIIVGFSDKNRTFRPIVISTTSDEKRHDFHFIFQSIQNGLARLKNVTLVADAADAKTNGFKYTFGENFIINNNY